MAKSKKTVKKAIKKVAKKPAKKVKPKALVKVVAKKTTEGKPIGKITHYYSNIEVAVVDLVAPLKEGDKIRIIGGQETDFEQEVKSMQIDHEEVKSAKKGDAVGMKVDEKVHEGYHVFKV